MHSIFIEQRQTSAKALQGSMCGASFDYEHHATRPCLNNDVVAWFYLWPGHTYLNIRTIPCKVLSPDKLDTTATASIHTAGMQCIQKKDWSKTQGHFASHIYQAYLWSTLWNEHTRVRFKSC